MNLKEVKQFIKDRPSYLKEGKKRLSTILKRQFGEDVDPELCAEAIREVRSELINSVTVERIPNTIDTSGLELKSKWQGANGQWLYSYKATSNSEVDKEDFILESLSDFKKYAPKQFPKRSPYKMGNCMMEISLPDLHIGKHQLEKQVEETMLSLETLISLIPSNVTIDRFVLPVGNDLLNTDTSDYRTTKGTPQFDTVEYQESFRQAWQLMADIINRLAQIAPVDVLIVPGNHDTVRSFYVGETLSALFTNHDGVNVDNHRDTRKYYKYGVTTIGYTHGDKEKIGDLPLLMASERKEDFAFSDYTEWHLGHIHKEMTLEKTVDDVHGTKIRFLPSICDNDTWHKAKGYSSLRDCQGLIYSKEKGFISLVNQRIKLT